MTAGSTAEHLEALLHDVHEGPTIDALPTIVHGILDGLQRGRAGVTVIRQNPALGTQIARLRWMFPDGRTPILLMPATPDEYFELAGLAMTVAKSWMLPVVITVEEEIAAAITAAPPPSVASLPLFEDKPRNHNLPLWLENDAAVLRWQGLVLDNADAFQHFKIDEHAGRDARRDWLVISYGHTSEAAQSAVNDARGQGLGVDHLVLHTLSPLAERAISAAAMGKKFVVVAERNTGQLHPDIQRLCPGLPCVLVQSALAPVRTEQVLNALMKFPRCC